VCVREIIYVYFVIFNYYYTTIKTIFHTPDVTFDCFWLEILHLSRQTLMSNAIVCYFTVNLANCFQIDCVFPDFDTFNSKSQVSLLQHLQLIC
jgi:hypothetical protein